MMEAPALMLATVTRAKLVAPWTVWSYVDRERAARLLVRVSTEMDPVLGTVVER